MIDCLQINHLINIIFRQQNIFFLKIWYSSCVYNFFFSFNYILPQISYVHVNLRLALISYLDVVKHKLSQYD